MAKKHGLGRGLNALLIASRTAADATSETKTSDVGNVAGTVGIVPTSVIDLNGSTVASTSSALDVSTAASTSELSNGLLEIALENVQPGQYQPRQNFHQEELDSLANSIRSQGILQPLVVRKLNDPSNQYEIIAGERRFRAAKLAGLSTVPVIVKQVSDEAALAMALIENIQRENLNALEEAVSLERLVKEFKLTHIEVAEAVGKSRTAITNSLRLLSLAEDVKALLERGEIEAGHAKVLLGLRGQEQSDIAGQVVARGLSVRETERLVAKQLEKTENHFPRRPHNLDPDIRRLQDNLSDKLGTRLEIQQNQQGKGKLVIHYNSLEELDGILEHIQ